MTYVHRESGTMSDGQPVDISAPLDARRPCMMSQVATALGREGAQ
jgi:hypothetical protein